jgi:hypothetical protein
MKDTVKRIKDKIVSSNDTLQALQMSQKLYIQMSQKHLKKSIARQIDHALGFTKRHDVMVCLYISSFSSPSHRSVQFNPALLDAPQLVRILRTGRVMLVRTFVKFISFLPSLFNASANRFRGSRSDTQRQPIIISTGREMCVTVCHSRCVVLFFCCLVFSCLDNFSIDHPLIFPSIQIVMLCIPLPLSCSHLV